MIKSKLWSIIYPGASMVLLLVAESLEAVVPIGGEPAGSIKIGWSSSDITPDKPVVICGGSSARISEGIKNHVFATALAMESIREDGVTDMVIMVSMDLLGITDILHKRVIALVKKELPEIDAKKVILNGTHTHTAPDQGTEPDLSAMHNKYGINVPAEWSRWGVDLGVMSVNEYVEFAAGQITKAIGQAWKSRKKGGISFGIAYATTGQNRLTAYYDGTSVMYGKMDQPYFSHVEGYEDHSLSLLYTWDTKGKLTGIMINIAMPSQVGYGTLISADYWHETRSEIRHQLGEEIYILPQVSAAGDQSPKMMINERAEKRMQQLTGRSQNEQIAMRIADGVNSILPFMEKNIAYNPVFRHSVQNLELPRRVITEKDMTIRRSTSHNPKVENVYESFDRLLGEFKLMYKEIEEHPEIRQKAQWYATITNINWLLSRAWNTISRYELQKTQFTLPVEVHVIRIGDMAIATNPFELYVDFGMQLKARSKATQTFIVELSSPGNFGYLPTQRSVNGGAYGAIPQSTLIGPDGGRELVDKTLDMINLLWNQ